MDGRIRGILIHNIFCVTELTQIESASLELEIFKVDESIAERSRKLLTTKLARLGARVPVTLAKDREVITVRTMVAGPRAVDIIYQVENWVCTAIFFPLLIFN